MGRYLLTRMQKQSEAAWVVQIIDAAHRYGWLAAHHPDSRRLVGDKGLPDIYLVRGDRSLWIEAKLDGKKPSTDQVQWHLRIRAAGGEVALLEFPRDWSKMVGLLR